MYRCSLGKFVPLFGRNTEMNTFFFLSFPSEGGGALVWETIVTLEVGNSLS